MERGRKTRNPIGVWVAFQSIHTNKTLQKHRKGLCSVFGYVKKAAIFAPQFL